MKLRNAETDHYRRKFRETGSSDSRQMWRTVKECTGSARSSPPTQLSINGQMFTNPAEMAAGMNSFFLRKVEKLREEMAGDVQISPIERLRSWLYDKTIPGLKLQPVMVSDVEKCLKKIKNNKTTGLDNIDGFSLSIAGPHIVQALCHIVNLSLQQGKFPKC